MSSSFDKVSSFSVGGSIATQLKMEVIYVGPSQYKYNDLRWIGYSDVMVSISWPILRSDADTRVGVSGNICVVPSNVCVYWQEQGTRCVWSGDTVLVITATRDQFLSSVSAHMLLSAHATCQALPLNILILIIIPWPGSVRQGELIFLNFLLVSVTGQRDKCSEISLEAVNMRQFNLCCSVWWGHLW